MFVACRRGIVSFCNASRVASPLFTPAARSSALSSSVRTIARQAVALRHLNTSSALGYQARTSAQPRYDNRYPHHTDEEHLEEGTVPSDAVVYTKFQELANNGLVNENIIHEITHGMGHQTMTPVQTMTINETLKGTDIIAQARTGTGKTLGFLLPVVQNILNKSPELADRRTKYARGRASDIRAIIISPTRELAEQIAVEAKKITGNTGIKVQVAVGGNSKMLMLRQMQREGCHLLVATPGRLNDLLTDPSSRVAAPDLSMLVLDEADRLLDSGFADEIEDIMKTLPDIRVQDRQTLLFSATVPKEVMSLVRRTLKEDFKFVQTIQKGEQATHEKVPQKIVSVAGLENLMPTLLELSKREIEKSKSAPDTSMPFKALVYFNSTANVELAAAVFENLGGSSGMPFAKHPLWPTDISNMHGKLTQQQRTRVSERFRRARSAIMFSSDVTARGMDFPNVSHVIQIGLPPDRDQYIHRIGRTGRGDKKGEGWLFITDMEARAARRRLTGLPLKPDTSLEAATVNMTQNAQLPAVLAETLTQITDATKKVDRETKKAAYMANIGVMSAALDDKQQLIDGLNRWTKYGWGWNEPPAVSKRLADMLGLSRLRGIVIGQRNTLDLLQRGEFNGRSGRDSSEGGFGGFSPDNNRRDRDDYAGGRGSGRGFGNGNGRDRSSYDRDRSFSRDRY